MLHVLDAADKYADRIVMLADGHLVADGTSAELKAQLSDTSHGRIDRPATGAEHGRGRRTSNGSAGTGDLHAKQSAAAMKPSAGTEARHGSPTDEVAAAVGNNASWCNMICRLHGIATEYSPSYWSAADPPPTFYPSAVTLRPDLDGRQIDIMLAHSAVGAVKDSYADLDLTSRGYEMLFSAQWMLCHPPQAEYTLPASSTVLESNDELEEWSLVHGAPGVPGESLLREPSVRLLAVRKGGRIVAGAVAHRSADVVGLSNVFGRNGACSAVRWVELTQIASVCFPGVPIVGYERGDAQAAAASAGFAPIAPLRVWRPLPAVTVEPSRGGCLVRR